MTANSCDWPDSLETQVLTTPAVVLVVEPVPKVLECPLLYRPDEAVRVAMLLVLVPARLVRDERADAGAPPPGSGGSAGAAGSAPGTSGRARPEGPTWTGMERRGDAETRWGRSAVLHRNTRGDLGAAALGVRGNEPRGDAEQR